MIKSETHIGAGSFDANDSNTKQHWLILTAEEMEFFDQYWTGINDLTSDPSSVGEGSWYDLNGRKLCGQPNRKGVYIYNNGRKVLF